MSYETIASWGKANAPIHLLYAVDYPTVSVAHLAIVGALAFDGWVGHPANTDELAESRWFYEQGDDSITCVIEPNHYNQTLTVTVTAEISGRDPERVSVSRSIAAARA